MTCPNGRPIIHILQYPHPTHPKGGGEEGRTLTFTSVEPEPAAEGSVTASSWNDDIEGALAGCPFDQFKGKIEEGFADGATVTVERGSGSITVTIKKGGSTSSMSGTWG